MLARRTTQFLRFCQILPRQHLPGTCLTGITVLLSACSTQDLNTSPTKSQSQPLWLDRHRNQKFGAGLLYLDSKLKDSSIVGDEQIRKSRWRLNWDPGSCTRPRGSELEITPGLQEFNRNNAYWLSWLSVQAYRQGDDARVHLAKVGLTQVDLINEKKSGFQAFVGSVDNFVVVSFSGTSEWIDYVTDLTFASKAETVGGIPGRVHIGFLNVLDRSWPRLVELVRKHATGGKPILLTGHSMGGAQAILSAVRLLQMGLSVDQVYIFAVPRLGDEIYANFVKKILPNRIWRFVNNEDIVPRLPPPPVAAGAFSRIFPNESQEAVRTVFEALQYKHIGQLVTQNGRGGLSEPRLYDEAEDVSYWQRFSERTQGRNIPEAVFANWRMIFDHIPFASHCQLNPPRASAFTRFTYSVE